MFDEWNDIHFAVHAIDNIVKVSYASGGISLGIILRDDKLTAKLVFVLDYWLQRTLRAICI